MIQIVTLFFNDMAMSPSARAYRQAVEPLLIKHNARNISCAKVKNTAPGQPDEIHIVKFENSRDFSDLQIDRDYLALADMREEAMTGTVTFVTEEYLTFLD